MRRLQFYARFTDSILHNFQIVFHISTILSLRQPNIRYRPVLPVRFFQVMALNDPSEPIEKILKIRLIWFSFGNMFKLWLPTGVFFRRNG